MRKILKSLWIIQEVSNENREPKLGRGFFNARRLNPYNPLSYITVIVSLIIGILMFGFVGFWKETDMRNPFKWD
jgi:predicted PurR-regulated permease PerM